MEVSVIIPTYGTPCLLERSIKSVLEQTYKDLELIIVDDNNPNTPERDSTEKIVCEFQRKDPRIIYIKHSCNKNGAVARNTGFAVAQGKYISLLDSDDEYVLDRLQKCYDVMEQMPSTVGGVYTGCEFRRSGKTYLKYTDVKDGSFLVETLACKFMFCTGSNIFVRKNVIDELNGFDETFLRHQDYEFLVRVFEKYSFKAIPEILVIKNNENFNLPNLKKLISIKKQYLEKFKYIIDTLPQENVEYIMHGNYINIAENAMAQYKFGVANQYYSEARRYGGLSCREWFRRIIYPVFNIISKLR